MEIDINNITRLYKSGLSLNKIGDIVGCSRSWIAKKLIANGIKRRSIARNDISTEDIVSLFANGGSVKSVAEILNISRSAVAGRLRKVRITTRNRSESMYLRMAKTDIEQRKSLTKKANESIRQMPKEFHYNNKIKQAVSKSISGKVIGCLEDSVYESLVKNDLPAIPQFPEGTYNIDIACGNVAVEVHINTAHPHTYPFYKKRVINLLKAGWNVFYIKISRKEMFINEAAMNKTIAVCKFCGLNPSVRGKYWVIRGTGELIAVASLNRDDLAVIKMPKDLFDFAKINCG